MRRLICFLVYYTSSTSFRQNAYVSFRLGIAYATSFLHILSKKGMKGVKPSASSGSHNSFIKPLASSLVSFSPKLVNSLKRSLESMVLSEFLSYNFKISTKSWMPPVSLESLAFEEGIHVLEADGLLALLLLTTNLSDGLHGGVQVAGANEVTNVETVDLAISLEVIDLEGELDFFNIPGVDAVFLSYFLIGCHFSSS